MTTIEWTDESWNPLRARAKIAGSGTGWACVRVSQGCVNCYAATFNKRLGTGLDYTVPALAKVTTYVDEKALAKPSTWRKPRRVFVCSMTDLFGEWVTDAEIDRVWREMASARRHTFQVLTKRPERMREYLGRFMPSPSWDGFVTRYGVPSNENGAAPVYTPDHWPLPNVWCGTSVENQETADERVPHLLATPAAVRFLSVEPMLGPVDLSAYLPNAPMADAVRAGAAVPDLGWVIVGGESGHDARPFNPAWARSLVEQCGAAGVAPFVKQMGSNWSYDEHAALPRPKAMRESHGRDMDEWPEDLRVREWPA